MEPPEEDKKKNRKKVETVRERAERAILEAAKPEKKQITSEAEDDRSKKLKFLKLRRKSGDAKVKKEKKPRRFHLTPKFIRNAFAEIKLVTWPDRKITTKLTFAVIIFATVFAFFVSLVDFGFGHLFKRIFLHG